MFINIHIIPSHWRSCQTISIFSYVWGFGVMRIQQLIVKWFKQALRKIFRNTVPHFTHVMNTEIRHKNPSCVRAPCVGLAIVAPHCTFQVRTGIVKDDGVVEPKSLATELPGIIETSRTNLSCFLGCMWQQLWTMWDKNSSRHATFLGWQSIFST